MLNCKEASELMSQKMDTALPLGKRLSLQIHLMMCHGCSNFSQQIQFLRKATQRWHIHDANVIPKLSENAKQRIARAIQEADAKDNSTKNN